MHLSRADKVAVGAELLGAKIEIDKRSNSGPVQLKAEPDLSLEPANHFS